MIADKAILNGTDTLPYMMHQKGWANVYKDGLASLETPTGSRSTTIKKSIESMMSSYGDGARAIVRVQWQGGGGHVFIAEQVNGATEFHNEPFVDAITDIGDGYVIGTVAKDGEVSDTPPVYVPKAGGKAEFFFIPDHFEEMKNGKMLKIPGKYKFNQ